MTFMLMVVLNIILLENVFDVISWKTICFLCKKATKGEEKINNNNNNILKIMSMTKSFRNFKIYNFAVME